MHRIKQTGRRLKQERDLVDVFISPLIYFPCTQLTEQNMENLVFDPTYFEKTTQPIKIPSDVTEIIRNHKSIFPQYYNLPKMIDYKYKFLSSFIQGIFSSFYDSEYKFIDEVIALYSGDILKLYQRIYEQNAQEIEKIYRLSFDTDSEKELKEVLLRCLMEESSQN